MERLLTVVEVAAVLGTTARSPRRLGVYGYRWIGEDRLSDWTCELDKMQFGLHIRPLLGARQSGKVTTDAVPAWCAELLRRGRSGDTTAKAYRLGKLQWCHWESVDGRGRPG